MGEGGVLEDLERAAAERARNAEMRGRLRDESSEGGRGRRDGYGQRRLLATTRRLRMAVLRDRLAIVGPQLTAKCRHRPRGFDDRTASGYALVWRSGRSRATSPSVMTATSGSSCRGR